MYEPQQRKKTLLERASEVLDLPAQAMAILPIMELVGDKELRIENHRGILAYAPEELHISGGAFLIKVQGSQLDLRIMTGVELLITGKISGIALE